MNLGFLTQGSTISFRRFVAVTIVTSGTLSWYFLLNMYFEAIFGNLAGDEFWVYIGLAIFLSCGALSAIVGSAISGKISRRKLLWSWITLGIFATASLAVFQGIAFAIFCSVLLGLSLGLGFPSCAALLADYTIVEERARIAGIIILETFVMVFIAIIVANFLNMESLGVIALCIILRATSYFALFLDPCEREKGREKAWRSILTQKDFAFYLIPWLIFNIASGLVSFVWVGILETADYAQVFAIGASVRLLGVAVFGIVAGIVADRLGRKQPIVIGLVLLGVGFAFLGLATSLLSVLVYLMFSGAAWGALLVVYFAVPGDLSSSGSKEKFYALGAILPLIVYTVLTAMPPLLDVYIPASLLSPILSILLFISVIPVLFAKETLSSKKIRERKMKEYVDRVGKLIQESKKTEKT